MPQSTWRTYDGLFTKYIKFTDISRAAFGEYLIWQYLPVGYNNGAVLSGCIVYP